MKVTIISIETDDSSAAAEAIKAAFAMADARPSRPEFEPILTSAGLQPTTSQAALPSPAKKAARKAGPKAPGDASMDDVIDYYEGEGGGEAVIPQKDGTYQLGEGGERITRRQLMYRVNRMRAAGGLPKFKVAGE